jgi:uncharacterized repeat protein (TIGR03803 family)
MRFPVRRCESPDGTIFSGWCETRCVLTMAVLFVLLMVALQPAQAQTETVLYSFCALPGCLDGSQPEGGLVVDTQGNLYGTTYAGGANRYGTVFEAGPSGTESVLHSFAWGRTDGAYPWAGLVMDAAGNLYGTTYFGGPRPKAGTVFKVSPGGTKTVLYDFCAQKPRCADGYHPRAGLIVDTLGNLYGTTWDGGTNDSGTVFKLSPSGTETILYSFCPQQPSCPDGYYPTSGVVMDPNGNLYGTTSFDGAHNGGTVFEVSQNGTETTLYSFCTQPHCADGTHPIAGVILDTKGNLYGTTSNGGAKSKGTVYEISPNGTETVLHSFCLKPPACTDGAHPKGGVILDAAGNIYGTTYSGGAYGYGAVFEITPSGTETVLHSFNPANGTDGSYPYAGVVMDTKGNLYGTTYSGGANGGGTVFQVVP